MDIEESSLNEVCTSRCDRGSQGASLSLNEARNGTAQIPPQSKPLAHAFSSAASAIVATVGQAQDFKNGRQLAAWMGLVPRQMSSGGKERPGTITKRGDTYFL